MKASKAPEKIYLYSSNIPDQEYEAEWGCMPWDKNSIEYTRTDAFIDKVCEWVNEQSFCGWIEEPVDEFIEELVKAMKGEE